MFYYSSGLIGSDYDIVREREDLKAHLVNVEKEKLELLKTLNEAEKLAAEKKAAADTADSVTIGGEIVIDGEDSTRSHASLEMAEHNDDKVEDHRSQIAHLRRQPAVVAH